MALNYDYLTAVTREKYIPKMEDNIYETSTLLKMLREDDRVILDGGTKVTQPLRYGKNTARGFYTGYEVFDVTPPDNLTAANFEWTNAYVSISISGDDEDKNMGESQVINLLNEKMEEGEMSMKDQISSNLFTGTSNLIGLDTAIDDGTYGGIAGGTYTWWQSGIDETAHTAANMIDSSHASYVQKLLRNGWKSCRHLGETPNLFITSQDTFDIYEQTLQVNARYPLSARGRFLADAGFSAVEFRQVPITVDDYVSDTADAMYALNTKFLSFYVHKNKNFKFTGFLRPTNQDARVGQVLVKCQLAISNRRMFYRWSDLNN